ncbi:type II toxin-antitoxin system VapC family toxin [Prosthecobacter sp.]|uniref:type II toxin-antitoxin system VapC family toxin n=1 Tax=Prosthecobacter sp. TaxID=1965333 RepID=UPI0037844272
MFILDTDHASELGFRSAAGLRLLSRFDQTESDVVITAITVEEQLRGWLAALKRHADPSDQVLDYARLVRQVELHAAWTVLPWDADAVRVFTALRKQSIRVGTQDLKIAAITIAHDGILLTRNTVDFQQVPGLQFENWLD